MIITQQPHSIGDKVLEKFDGGSPITGRVRMTDPKAKVFAYLRP
jgi:hypothetical protein